jgi:hypothetical protein
VPVGELLRCRKGGILLGGELNDPALRQLVDAGYATVYYPPARLRDGYWTFDDAWA